MSAPGAEDMLVAVVTMMRERLPREWMLRQELSPAADSLADAVMALRAPGGPEVRMPAWVKSRFEARDVPHVVAQRNLWGEAGAASPVFVVARYLSPPTRDRLAEAGVSYADATGNMLVRIDSPAVFILTHGADADPWRGPGRPTGSLKGAPAARVIRTLLDFSGPWRVTDLMKRSATPPGSVYRVLQVLEEEGLAERDAKGAIVVPDWPALLRRWSRDYQFLTSNAVSRWIAPRGLLSLQGAMRGTDEVEYALTGSLAAATWSEYAPARLAMVHVTDVDLVAREWGLRPTEAGANVLLAQVKYRFVLERSLVRSDGVRVAAPSQVAADLLTGPGRAPVEGEELIEWMRQNETQWRR